MARVIELHIWMQNKKETWHEPEIINQFGNDHRGKRIVLDIEENTTIAEMKIAVATELDKYITQLRYYYVVAKVQRDDETIGYRTIVPQTYPKKRKGNYER
jgi:hypothetical protein